MKIPKITDKELAEYLWIHTNTITAWNRGEYNPSIDKVKKIRKRAERKAMTFEDLIAECDRVIARSKKMTKCFK